MPKQGRPQDLKSIAVIGSLNADLVTTTPRVPIGGETLTASSFSTGPGGKGANQAVACARLSKPKLYDDEQWGPDTSVRMVGAVGKDEYGSMLVQSLKDSGVNTATINVVKGGTTGLAVIIVEEGSGENRIMLVPGTNHSLKPEDFLTPKSLAGGEKFTVPDLIILQLEIPLETVLQILKTAKEAGVDVLLNPAPAVKLPDEAYTAVTHLIVNETEAAILTGRSVEEVEKEGFDWGVITSEFLAKGVKNVVVTLGSKGAYYASSETQGLVPAAPVEKVVDTTAAGDTFVGAYAVSMVHKQGEGLVTGAQIQKACKASARVVEKEGAQTSIPWYTEDEIDDLEYGN